MHMIIPHIRPNIARPQRAKVFAGHGNLARLFQESIPCAIRQSKRGR